MTKTTDKMTTLLATMLAGMAMVMMSSCRWDLSPQGLIDDSPKVSEQRQLSGFQEVEINGSPTVVYTQADTFSVVVKGRQKAIDDIVTEVNGQTLTVRNRGKVGVVNININDHDELTVLVTSPDLTGIRINGSGDFISHERIDTDEMAIVLKGSGDIRLEDMICDRCDVEQVGSGNVSLKRLDAKTVKASLIGSGDLDMNLWNVAATQLSLRGSGDVEATFSGDCREVECDQRGSGDIELKGHVERLSKRSSGSGSIETKRLTVGK